MYVLPCVFCEVTPMKNRMSHTSFEVTEMIGCISILLNKHLVLHTFDIKFIM